MQQPRVDNTRHTSLVVVHVPIRYVHVRRAKCGHMHGAAQDDASRSQLPFSPWMLR